METVMRLKHNSSLVVETGMGRGATTDSYCDMQNKWSIFNMISTDVESLHANLNRS